MAMKTANVTARVHPEIKQHSFSLPSLQTRDAMSDEKFDSMMLKGLNEAKSGYGLSVEEAFAELNGDTISVTVVFNKAN